MSWENCSVDMDGGTNSVYLSVFFAQNAWSEHRKSNQSLCQPACFNCKTMKHILLVFGFGGLNHELLSSFNYGLYQLSMNSMKVWCHVVCRMFTFVSEEPSASILKMEAADSCKTSANIYQTIWCYIPEVTIIGTNGRTSDLKYKCYFVPHFKWNIVICQK